jgi:uncharacterized protein YcfJ
MKTLTRSLSLAVLGLTLAPLTACNPPAAPEAAAPAPVQVASRPAPPKCYDCGTIVNVEQMKAKGEGTGMGIAIGAVLGAAAGHQVGDGRGKQAATVGGAVVGGYAGNEVEKRARSTTYFHVTVAMEHGGGTRTVDVEAMNGLGTGSHVKIVGSNLQAVS